MPEAPLLALSIERSSRTPLVQQVYEFIRRRINSGQFSGGDRLPATRNFAAELGVSRTTVVAAYEQLVAEGYLQGLRGSGYYVSQIGPVELDVKFDAEPDTRRAAGRAAAASADLPPRPVVGAPKPFQPGLPDMRRFPYRQWARSVARVARSSPEAMIESGDPFGDVPLRCAIARHLAEWRGVNASPRQILVTAGSGDALENCIRTLAGPGDRIALEDPGYLPLRGFVQSLGLKPLWLEVSANGAEVPDGPESVPHPGS